MLAAVCALLVVNKWSWIVRREDFHQLGNVLGVCSEILRMLSILRTEGNNLKKESRPCGLVWVGSAGGVIGFGATK